MSHTISISGRVGRVDALRHLQDGTAVLNFSLASREGKKQDGTEITRWFECSLWKKHAEAIAPHLAKGMAVSVYGTVDVRAWESNGRSGASLTVRVEKMDMQSRAEGGERQSQQSGQSGGWEPPPDLDDEIPFVRNDTVLDWLLCRRTAIRID